MIRMHSFGLYILLIQLSFLVVNAVSYDRCRVYIVSEKDSKSSSLSSCHADVEILTDHREFDRANNHYTLRSYLVPEHSENAFRKALDISGANYNILVHDLGKEIQEETNTLNNFQRSGFAGLVGVLCTYYSYNEMSDFLKDISKIKNSKTSKPLALIEPIGSSFEGRQMQLVKISSNHAAEKPIIFFEAGMHAREWTASSTALYMIYQLVGNHTYNYKLLEDIDYYIIPLSNPDGYEYSRTEDRLWRKTRSYYRGRYGVDGNRNFDFHWGEAGTSTDPESQIFHGPKPFSEKETRNIRDAGNKYKNRIIAFVSIHAFGSFILYPWGYKAIKAPQSDVMEEISLEAIKAIKKFNGTTYRQGTSSILLYEAAGGSDDYFKGVLGVNLTFTVEVAHPKRSFIVPAKQIRSIAGEAFEGFKAIAHGAVKYHRGKFDKMKKN